MVIRLVGFGILGALGMLLAQSIEWNSPLTALAVLKLLGLWLIFVGAAWAVRRDWRIWKGLDQWPTPQGRYYTRWLALPPEEAGDYYSWLARKKGGIEPWASWARTESDMNRWQRDPDT